MLLQEIVSDKRYGTKTQYLDSKMHRTMIAKHKAHGKQDDGKEISQINRAEYWPREGPTIGEGLTMTVGGREPSREGVPCPFVAVAPPSLSGLL